jgi:hypothetical protein
LKRNGTGGSPSTPISRCFESTPLKPNKACLLELAEKMFRKSRSNWNTPIVRDRFDFRGLISAPVEAIEKSSHHGCTQHRRTQ